MSEHTPTPWFVTETKHPHYLGGEHIERRIFTVDIHPQLKDHDGVVNASVGLGPVQGGPATHMVAMSEEDAAFIVKACNSHDALVKAMTRAVKYYDEIDRLLDDGEAEILDAMATALKAALSQSSAGSASPSKEADRG